jgi:hypothetical protein
MRLTPAVLTAMFLAVAAAACVDEPEVVLTADGAADGGGKADGGAAFRRCTGRAFTAPAATGFRHTSSKVAALTGARHRAQDVIATPSTRAELVAKFAYGPTWKDLEDENAAFYVDNCAGWVALATRRTDDDGLATLAVNVNLPAGVYEVRAVARGDASTTLMNLWVLPRGTHLAVTDIDGTMTTADTELFKQIFDGSYVPQAYPSAQALTKAHAERGHVVVYLTGRPAWLLPQTRAWLAQQGFAPGPIHAADSNLDILPTDGSVGAYKTDWLDELEADGATIDLAYGNATTDIHGYKDAGIPVGKQWIIGPNAGAEGTNAVSNSWATRAAQISSGARVTQPW